MHKRSKPVITITGSIGRGGKNNAVDVVNIQKALNLSILVTEKLTVDGRYGPKTFNAILQYQLGLFHSDGACDGRIDPDGKTLISFNNERMTMGRTPVHMERVQALADKLCWNKNNVSAEQLVKNPRIIAMLDVLGLTEGTGNNYGKVVNGLVIKSPNYPDLVGKRNVSVNNFSLHPDILVKVNTLLKSTAAGRYQFLKSTWDELGMPDFSPCSQDIAAVKRMQRRGMIDFLLTGDLDKAVYKGAPEWASLPTASGESYYDDQPGQSMENIRKFYKAALQKYQK